jgi:magnesium transporter
LKAEITKEFVEELKSFLAQDNEEKILELLEGVHPVELAKIIEDEFSAQEAYHLFKYLSVEEVADILAEIDEDLRIKILKLFSTSQIASLLEYSDSDDAADIFADLPQEIKQEVLAKMDDVEQAGDIVELTGYEEGTAGSIMAKELIKVNINWNIATCIKELRKQAEEVDKVYTIYVVDDDNVLKGRISLKRIILSPDDKRVKDIYEDEILSVKANDPIELVAQKMKDYDLVVVPVVDEVGRLIGRITIDDVVDVLEEEAEKDFQMASGITENVDASDSVWILSRSRLPWLMIGLMGELVNSKVISGYESEIQINPQMAFFMPLIAAMGGNAGVQSSAIVVQGLANNTMKADDLFPKLFKEFLVALLNGVICAIVVFGFNYFVLNDLQLSKSVSISLFTVIIFASIFGAFVPLTLSKFKIDPALATGPFITTANDIVGIFIYFYVGSLFYA